MQEFSALTKRHFYSAVTPHIHELKRYALSLTRNAADADDLLQDTLIRSCMKLHLWQPGTNMAAWLSVMMRRIFISKYVQGLRNRTEILPIEDYDCPSDGVQEYSVQLSEIEARWPRLPFYHRDVLKLVAIEGASYEEAAQRLGLPVGTVRSRLHRAREALRS
jgi:RNA polymerase sigma-70 factor (ECF subfamily)